MPMLHGASAITSLRPCMPSPMSTARGSFCGISPSENSARSTAARSSGGRGRCSTRCRRSSSTASSSARSSMPPLLLGVPSGLDNFALYLLCGLLPWNFFGLITSLGLGAVSVNSGLVRRVAFPREVLVFSNVLHACVQFSIEMTLLFIVLLIAGSPFLPWLPAGRPDVDPACDLRNRTRAGALRARCVLPRRELPVGDRHPGLVLRNADRLPAVAARGTGAAPGCTTSSSSTR